MRSISYAKALIYSCLAVALASCNTKSETESVYEPGSLAVTAFSIQYDNKNVGVDSAYFAIDLNNGVIYNPDSLAPGTKIDKLIPVIKYNSSVESATITMTGGQTRTGSVDYATNPTDSIDFTGNVMLTLARGSYQRTYDIKVNVHRQKADSLRWDEAALTTLPSRLGAPLEQKTVALENGKTLSLIREKDNSYTLATSNDLFRNVWVKTVTTFPFTPRIESLTASGSDIYILDDNGTLYKGDLTGNWTSTGETWSQIIGSYVGSIVGIADTGSGTYFTQYPLGDLNVVSIPEDFPTSGYSNFVTLQNKWTLSPVAFFVGGREADGSLSPATWAFDGAEWIRLSDAGFPAMELASLVPYYYYRRTASGSSLEEFKVWMVMGGRQADGSANRTVYISYDNGVNWQKGSSLLQLPDVMPQFWGCDNIVSDTPMSAPLSDNWTRMFKAPAGPQRISSSYQDGNIRWDCPYIYLFGGAGPDSPCYDTIWRGVLNRLTFTPII